MPERRNAMENTDGKKSRNGQDRERLEYSDAMCAELIKKDILKMLVYCLEIVLWVAVVKLYANFGVKIVVPAVSAMWVMGAVTAFFVKDDQENTVKGTKTSIAGYLLFLLMYRFVIQKVGGLTSQEIAVSLGINVTAAAGMAVSAWLQNILLISAVSIPIGYLVWCAQKFKTFHGRERKTDAFDRIKDIRREHPKY